MSQYLLDTTVLIDISHGDRQVIAAIDALIDDGHTLGICAINLVEFYSGLDPSEWMVAGAFLGELEYWEMTEMVAVRAGIHRYAWARRGITLSATDALVATTAIANGAILLTSNTRHFPFPELVVQRIGAPVST